MFTYDQIFGSKQRVLFVTAHPDDLVVFFGGLIHQLRADGKEVYALLVTTGARGSRDKNIDEEVLAKQRLIEEATCLEALNISQENSFCLGYADGEVESNMKLIGEISKYIRKFKVDLVATHEPSLLYIPTYSKDGFFVQHRDHRKTGEATIDAVYPFSRDRSFFKEHYAEGIEPHEVFDILLTDEKESNFAFDCTPHLELKKQAMRAHKSQFDENTINEIITAFSENGICWEKFNYLKLQW